jgi:hypothetical protein
MEFKSIKKEWFEKKVKKYYFLHNINIACALCLIVNWFLINYLGY